MGKHDGQPSPTSVTELAPQGDWLFPEDKIAVKGKGFPSMQDTGAARAARLDPDGRGLPELLQKGAGMLYLCSK